MTAPLLSVIIPCYNRERLLGRAIASCLQQAAAPDFELIVVNDGSSDGALGVAEQYAASDPRVRVLSHATNLGLAAARNSGVALARAEWVLFLDNDDELLPGALGRVAMALDGIAPHIGRLMFMQQVRGGTSPRPSFTRAELDYAGYVVWQSRLQGYFDHTVCTRRSTFEAVGFPLARTMEHRYDFDFHRRFVSLTVPEMVVRRNDDDPVRAGYPTADVMRVTAAETSGYLLELLDDHGPDIAAVSWKVHRRLTRHAALLCLLAGNTPAATRLLAGLQRREPLMPDLLALRVGALLGADALTAGIWLYRAARGRLRGQL